MKTFDEPPTPALTFGFCLAIAAMACITMLTMRHAALRKTSPLPQEQPARIILKVQLEPYFYSRNIEKEIHSWQVATRQRGG